MKDQGRDKKKDQIRVVEDEPEEVVRLDVAKMDPLERKGKIAREILPPKPDQESGEEGSPEVIPEKKNDDPEVEWSESESESGEDAVPVGWFVLLGVVLIGVLLWVVFQSKDGDPVAKTPVAVEDKKRPVDLDVPKEDIPKSPKEEEEEIRLAEDHFRKMEQLVAAFFSAGSVDELAKYVRHPERVVPLMKEYYQDHPWKPRTFERTKEYHIVSFEKASFIALETEVAEEKEGQALLLEDFGDEMKVDWESHVCYQPMTPEAFVAEKPEESVSFRAYVQRSDFYAYEFSDEREYICYQMRFRESDTIIYGYVKRNSRVEQQFKEVFPYASRAISKPLVLKVKYLPGTRAKRSVLIEDLEAVRWAYATNPEAPEKGQ